MLRDGLRFLREVECGLIELGRLQRVLMLIALHVAAATTRRRDRLDRPRCEQSGPSRRGGRAA